MKCDACGKEYQAEEVDALVMLLDLPERKTFFCGECGHVITVLKKRKEPVTLDEIISKLHALALAAKEHEEMTDKILGELEAVRRILTEGDDGK